MPCHNQKNFVHVNMNFPLVFLSLLVLFLFFSVTTSFFSCAFTKSLSQWQALFETKKMTESRKKKLLVAFGWRKKNSRGKCTNVQMRVYLLSESTKKLCVSPPEMKFEKAKRLKKLGTLWQQSIAPVSFKLRRQKKKHSTFKRHFKNNISLFIFYQTFSFLRKSTGAINCSWSCQSVAYFLSRLALCVQIDIFEFSPPS